MAGKDYSAELFGDSSPAKASKPAGKDYSAELFGKKDIYADQVSKQSTVENLLAGIGGGMYRTWLGAKQLAGQATPEEIEDNRQAMAGLTSTKAGTVGNIIGTVAPTVPLMLIPGVNSYAGSAAVGGLSGALEPTLEGESKFANVGMGAAGGAAGKYVGDKVLRVLSGAKGTSATAAGNSASSTGGSASASSTVSGGATARGTGGGYSFGFVGDDASAGLTRSQQEIMQRGKQMGMKVTPGQASGSKALQQMEAKLESQPMTSGTFNSIKANNQTVLNRAAANAIGEDVDVLDSHVLAQAQHRISEVYDQVADKTVRKIDPDSFVNKLAAVESDFEGLTPGSVLDNPLVKRLYGLAAKGEATGEQLQALASKLGTAANNHMTATNGDRHLGMALFKVKELADDLLQSGLSGDKAEAFSQARKQYRNLMLLTQRNGVINPSTGNINGNALAGLLQQKDRAGFLFGKNKSELYDAARFAQAFRPIVGDSGTATRMPLTSKMDFVLGLPFNIATKAYASAPSIRLATGATNISQNGVSPVLGGLLEPVVRKPLPFIGGALGGGLLVPTNQ